MAEREDNGIRVYGMTLGCIDLSVEPASDEPLCMTIGNDFEGEVVRMDADGARILGRYLIDWANSLPSGLQQ